MSLQPIVVPFQCATGEIGQCHITISPSGYGWDVSVEMDKRIVFTSHCTDWHQVERLCDQRTWMRSSPAGSTAG
jgi:hypothetical protein